MKWLLLALIALTYHVLGQISFLTALPDSPSGPTLVWLPTGFAVGVVFLYGFRVWPAIAFGSFINADLAITPLHTAIGFTLTNTLDPLLVVWLVHRLIGQSVDFSRPRDVTKFIGVVSLVSSVVSATMGATTLQLSKSVPSFSFLMSWSTWWISDVVSVLVIVPLMMAWARQANAVENKNRVIEKILVAIIGLAVLFLIFSIPLGKDTIHFIYWVFPFIIWHAFRHGFRVATTSMFILALVTIGATSQGIGPFLGKSVVLSFLYVQSFLVTSAMTTLLVVALVAERDRAIQNRDEFFLIASRELSAPLSMLGMLSKFLDRLVAKEELDSMTRTQRAELVKMNSRETQRLSRLVEDLLEGSRISAGKLVLHKGEMDLASLVREVVDEVKGQTELAGVSIYLDAPPEAKGEWDEKRMLFVVRTLIENALKFGENKPVSVSVARESSHVELVIEDKGVGIPLENQSRIFERFARLDSSAASGGLGQGLFISAAIVRAHGGEIAVKSAVGRGSRFSVRLPVVTSAYS